MEHQLDVQAYPLALPVYENEKALEPLFFSHSKALFLLF